jgi:hypothetical protein
MKLSLTANSSRITKLKSNNNSVKGDLLTIKTGSTKTTGHLGISNKEIISDRIKTLIQGGQDPEKIKETLTTNVTTEDQREAISATLIACQFKEEKSVSPPNSDKEGRYLLEICHLA